MKKINEQTVIKKTYDFMKKQLEKESSGHDWWHVHRVHQNALIILKSEKADRLVVSAAALLHDIADYKLHNGDCEIGPRIAGEWLRSQGVDEARALHVSEIIRDLSFKGAGVQSPMRTIEGKIVQDADRLEAIGAVGVARTFAYGGHKGRAIYDPKIKPRGHKTFAQYKNSVSPTLNHFYEKLLLLKDLMNTKTAKKIARQRHDFMVTFLKQFFTECGDKPPRLQK